MHIFLHGSTAPTRFSKSHQKSLPETVETHNWSRSFVGHITTVRIGRRMHCFSFVTFLLNAIEKFQDGMRLAMRWLSDDIENNDNIRIMPELVIDRIRSSARSTDNSVKKKNSRKNVWWHKKEVPRHGQPTEKVQKISRLVSELCPWIHSYSRALLIFKTISYKIFYLSSYLSKAISPRNTSLPQFILTKLKLFNVAGTYSVRIKI